MAASHQEIYTMQVSIPVLCNVIRSREFADQLRTEIKSENPMPNGVWYRIHHGVSFSSWGEKITITLTALAENTTQVTIHSECGMPTQVVDWGKNRQVVCNIYEYLTANVGRFAAPQQYTQQPYAQPVQQAYTQPVQAQQPYAQPAPVQPGIAFCSNCGTPVSGAGNFCSACGNKLR